MQHGGTIAKVGANARRYLLVVDTCTLLRAAEPSAEGDACRDVLDAILTVCHKVAVPQAILTEYRANIYPTGKVASRLKYVSEWLVAMFNRSKVKQIQSPQCDNLRRALGKVQKQKLAGELWGDLKIVEAALAADSIVISVDKAATSQLALLRHSSCAELDTLAWIIVDTSGQCEQFLRGNGTLDVWQIQNCSP